MLQTYLNTFLKNSIDTNDFEAYKIKQRQRVDEMSVRLFHCEEISYICWKKQYKIL